MADGYHVAAVSEYVRKGKEIPCGCYMGRKKPLDQDVIYTVEYIYEPDMILFFLDKKRFCADAILDIVDIRILKIRGRMELKSKEDLFVSGDCRGIYEYILSFFPEQECDC